MYKCIICNEDSFIINHQANIENLAILNIMKCKNCGLEYFYPIPNSNDIDKFYSTYVDGLAREDIVEKNSIRNIESLQMWGLTKKSRLLDFGCGKNIFVKTGQTENWKGYDKYSAVSLFSSYHCQKWDFITMWGVLANLITPKDTLQDLSNCLDFGGKLVLTDITIEAKIPCRRKYEHITYWTKKAIEILFDSVGLDIVEYRPYMEMQDSDVYLSRVMQTVPDDIRNKIFHKLPKYIEVPTNQVFVVGIKR